MPSGTSASRAASRSEPGVEEVVAVDVEHVEEVRRDRDAGRPGRGRGLWKGGASVLTQGERLTVDTKSCAGRGGDLDHLGESGGDVVEAAGRDLDVATAVDLIGCRRA
jgi:hypothetical protein